MGLNLLQINLNHCIEASTNLILYINRNKVDMILIQEPWVTARGICGLNHTLYEIFCFFFFCTNSQKNRTCILAKKELKCFLLNQFTNRDQTVVEMQKDGKKILIASTYFSHDDDSDPPPEITKRLTKYSEQSNVDLIMGCDANAHHIFWGSTDTNERGLFVMEYVDENKLYIANRGSKPTFETRVRKYVINLTLMTQLNGLRLLSWKVSNENTFSDHKYLEFMIETTGHEPIQTFRNPRRINWGLFITSFSNSIYPLLDKEVRNSTDIEHISSNLERCFDVAYKTSCPFTKYKNRKNPEWWHKDLEKLKTKTRKALNAAKKQNSDGKWESYKQKRKEFKKQIRKSKRQCFVDKLKELESIKDTSRLRKLMSKQNYVPSNIKSMEGEWTTSAKETLETLFKKHFPGCQLNTGTELVSKCHENSGYMLDPNLITIEKIKWAIGTFGPYKSPGIDNIYPIMLHKTVTIIGELLKRLFIACIEQSYVPKNWRKVKVVFIPKVGKIQHSEAKDYRPISLSSFVLKTVERILDDHIRDKMQHMIFSPCQHAYIKGKSVETALHSLTTLIEQSIYQGEYALACFLDIEGAFNNIKSEAIEEALSASGSDNKVKTWIMKILTQRQIQAELGGSVLEATATRGTPQGGVISPTLWILTLNGILLELNRTGIGVVAYADDVVLLVRGKFPNTLAEIMELALKSLYKWSTKCGLGINPSKTEMVLFTRKNLPPFRLPKLCGKTLELSKEAKFLGVIFDQKLKWVPNLKERINKCYAAMYSCQKLIGKTWGLKPRLIYWIYKAIVRPTLTHGSLVWWPIMDTKTHAASIERVNRVVALSISGASRSTATEALCRILDMDPLHLHIKEYALRTQVRLNQCGQMTIKDRGHSYLIGKFSYINVRTDYLPSHIIWDKEITALIPPRENWEDTNRNIDGIEVYTDGSKKESGTGCGVFCEKLDIRYSCKLNNGCSIFQAEIFAVSIAARLISMRPIFRSDITIYIDSQATIMALSNRNIRSKVVSRCRRELQVLNEQHVLKLCWVPGHYNIRGNENADELARAGADMDISYISEEVYPGLESVYYNIKKQFKAVADTLWYNSNGCKQTKTLLNPNNSTNMKTLAKMEKYELRMYVSIITGHCKLKHFLKKIRLCNDDICRWCNEDEEDTLHFLCQCVALSHYRFKCFDSYFFQNLEDLVGMDPIKIVKYIKLTKLYEVPP